MPTGQTFTYPSSNTLDKIEQAYLPKLVMDNPIFDILPTKDVPTHILTWEQMDNYTGMTQVRGLNGQPPRVNPVGLSQYTMMPGTYGEYMTVEELEMVVRRSMGTFADPIDVTDLVVQRSNQLLNRQVKRLTYLGWQLLISGVFVITDLKGAVLHRDSYVQRTYTAAVTWATSATATPFADFRNVQLLSRGYSVRFDSSATAYMNRTTSNSILSNTNANDLAGRRTAGLSTVLSIKMFNELAMGEGLPQIAIWDEGYIDDNGNFQLDIPNGRVLVRGNRMDGAPIGNWNFTRNAVNPGMAPGPYNRVFEPERNIPPTIEVHRGFNGGHSLYFPSALIVMQV